MWRNWKFHTVMVETAALKKHWAVSHKTTRVTHDWYPLAVFIQVKMKTDVHIKTGNQKLLTALFIITKHLQELKGAAMGGESIKNVISR